MNYVLDILDKEILDLVKSRDLINEHINLVEGEKISDEIKMAYDEINKRLIELHRAKIILLQMINK